ncbi:MAG TPA: ABC transporter permease [Bryobacteraceae bacterium]|nr:ABC transporter permease [Bryobacteraceae bacterium]
MTGFLDDFRHGVRGLGKNRGFAAVAVLSLALGIGANTTIFTFLNAIFLRPLPVRDASRLVGVYTQDVRISGLLLCSYPNYRDYRDHNRAFSSLLLYTGVVGTLTGRGEPEPLTFQLVSANYFQALGVRTTQGREFLPEEDRVPSGSAVAVISDALWKSRFGGDPDVTRRSVGINGYDFQIIGVAPPGFRGLDELSPADVWVPLTMYPQIYPYPAWVNERRALVFSVAGRLLPGVSLERAESELRSTAQELEREYPRDNEGRSPKLKPLAEAAINPAMRDVMTRSAAVLMIVAALVLLIACGNVASLLMGRAAARNKEITVRLALGASRWRVIRQLLAESTVLALAGGLLGLAMAVWARSALWALRPPQLRVTAIQVDLDGRVLGFSLAISLLTGLLFGLAPALRATNPDLAVDLKERSGQPRGGGRSPRSLLVASEVALCVVALIGAALFVRSLRNAERLDPGFDAAHLGMVRFSPISSSYSEARGKEFQRRVVEQIAGVPGIVSTALSRDVMLRVTVARTVVTENAPQGGNSSTVLVSPVSPNYLRTTGIRLLRGRGFNEGDTEGRTGVAVINEAAAARYWPHEDPIGKLLRFSGGEAPLQVIGIARNANYVSLGETPRPLVYTSLLQDYASYATLVYRSSGDPAAILGTVKREMQSLEPDLLLDGQSVGAVIHNSLWAPRISAGLLAAFGGLALLLALVGIYGVISYSVNQRAREIGVRMALGATAGSVQRLLMRECLVLVGGGIGAGLAVALFLTRGVRSLLFVTDTWDGVSFTMVPCVLLLVALAACWIPAQRATRIDPARALHEE